MQISVTKCDRCGEIEPADGPLFARVRIEKSSRLRGTKNRPLRGRNTIKELCPACEIMLETFLKGEPPPELVPALVPI